MVGGVRTKHFPRGNSVGPSMRPSIVKPSFFKPSSTIRNIQNTNLHKNSKKNHTVDEYDMTYYVLQEFVNSVNEKICFNTFFVATHPILPTFGILFDYEDMPDKIKETSEFFL